VGDIVNLAARLMGVAEKDSGGVLCDELTSKNAMGVTFVPQPLVRVKGKAEPIATFRPEGTMSGRWSTCGVFFALADCGEQRSRCWRRTKRVGASPLSREQTSRSTASRLGVRLRRRHWKARCKSCSSRGRAPLW
jgi:hypothetical protein